MKKILLAGYYGYGNLGDEAILEMFLEIFDKSNNIKEVTVLSGNTKETTSRYNVNSINRYNIPDLIKQIISVDALVFCGGSLLQDVTSKRSIMYYLSLIKIAKLFNKKVYLLSQGIGPINHKNIKKRASKILQSVDFITVRDYRSLDLLISMGIDKNKIKFSADPVIALCSDNKDISEQINNKVCFSLRNWKEFDFTDEICEVVNKLYNVGIESTFMCFHHNLDISLHDEIKDKLGDKAKFITHRLNTTEAMDIIKKMDLLVGVRLHSLILAASAYVPIIALSYDPKIDEFLKCLNLTSYMNINSDTSINVDNLYNEIMYNIDNKKIEQEKLIKNVGELKKTLNVNLDIINNI